MKRINITLITILFWIISCDTVENNGINKPIKEVILTKSLNFLDLDTDSIAHENLFNCHPDTMLGSYDIGIYLDSNSYSIHSLGNIIKVNSTFDELVTFPKDSTLTFHYDNLEDSIVIAVLTLHSIMVSQNKSEKYNFVGKVSIKPVDDMTVKVRYFCQNDSTMNLIP